MSHGRATRLLGHGLGLLSGVALALLLVACGGGNTPMPTQPINAVADLSTLKTMRVELDGVAFEVFVAQTPAEQERGLMFATPAQLAPLPDGTPRGMLFPFPSDRNVGFVMNQTFIPLDLAYIRSDGLIVEIHDLIPLDGTPVYSAEPIRYALEVNAGDLSAHGISVTDMLTLPVP